MGNAWPDTKLNPELEEKFIALLKEGQHIKTACAIVGITPQCYYAWKNKGLRGDPVYATFTRRAIAARAESAKESIVKIRKAGDEDWRAHAWFLERSFPNDYGATERHRHEIERGTLASIWELAGKGNGPSSAEGCDDAGDDS